MKMAIIGMGGMAGWHFRNIKEHISGIEIVAGYDIDKNTCEKRAAEWDIKVYETPEELYADPTIDLVLIATPNDVHKEYSIKCMEAGKNVICEKPVTMNVAELEDVMAVAKKTGKFFSIHQNRRWDADYMTVKKVLADGMLRNPYTIKSSVHGSKRLWGWRAFKPNGGGLLLDWGVHLIDQILWMINEPVSEVYANMHSVKTPEVDDYFKLLIRFESGLSAQVEVGTYNLERLPRWYVCGDGGALVIQHIDAKEGKIIHSKDFEMEWTEEVVQTEGGPTRTMAPRPKETLEELPLPTVETDWTDYYKNIMAVLDGREELIVKPEEARKVMQVMAAAFESHETGRSVRIDRYYKVRR